MGAGWAGLPRLTLSMDRNRSLARLKRKIGNYQEMTLVITYHRPTSPAAMNTNILTFSQK